MKKGDNTPLRVKKSLNQKSGSVKTFSIGKLVYVEDFITFDEERGPGPKDKHTHKQTNKHTYTHQNHCAANNRIVLAV